MNSGDSPQTQLPNSVEIPCQTRDDGGYRVWDDGS